MHIFHSLHTDKIFEHLSTSLKGLSSLEVEKRQEKYGLNELPHKEPPGVLHIFMEQFKNPLIYVLLVAAIVSILLREFTDAGFIGFVLLLNAVIGTIQEFSAEKSAASLQELLKIVIRVLRDGKEVMLDAKDLVPGDIVLLESGNKAPADMRLIEVKNLLVDESLLTGESVEVEKMTDTLPSEIHLSERKNMVYAGSMIMSGRAIGVVVTTGASTEVGKLALSVSKTETLKPPLVIRMEVFSKKIALVILVAVIFLSIIAYFQGYEFSQIFFFAVALAVSAIPEGLPVAITVTLSVATSRMTKRHVIVRKLTAVEGLGSCTFIASDKTGTLTVNKQTVKTLAFYDGEVYKVSGEGYNGIGEVTNSANEKFKYENHEDLKKLVNIATLSNEGKLYIEEDNWKHSGDAVDVALLSLGFKSGIEPDEIINAHNITEVIPYESEKKYAGAVYKTEPVHKVALKGAVETLLPLCDKVYVNGKPEPLDKSKIEELNEELTSQGYRVLAAVEGEIESDTFDEEKIGGLVFAGLIGLIDPLRPEAKDSIDECRDAGVEVAVVTGDHPLTALAISRELHIADEMDQVITGQQLQNIDDHSGKEFIDAIKNKRVFARVTPLQKMYIVRALNKAGHFVAVTGDGVNDVPALKMANIGVAMGSGTDLAKETAEIIVTDDNFESIKSGIEEGRFAYDNIRKVVYLLISCGAAEILMFIFSLLAGLRIPLTAVQLLWLNVVTNGIQHVGLAFEAGEPESMKKPPRKPTEGIFNPLMIKQVVISGATMGLLAFGVWYYLMTQGYSEEFGRSVVLLLMVFLQNVHVFNCRSEYKSAFKVPINKNWFIVFAVIGAQLVHIISTNIPFMQNVLGVEALPIEIWFTMLGFSFIILIVMEVFKKIIRSRWKIAHSN